MNILIVEDEVFAFKKLRSLLEDVIPNIKYIAHAKSIEESISIIKENKNIDLGFFDIQLNDGISFDIFDKTNVYFPVIFTTAYNDYALRAFKHNSIDYLLKPIDKSDLEISVKKYTEHWKKIEPNTNITAEVKDIITTGFKSRFTIKVGEHIKIIPTKDICLFYTQNKTTYIKTTNNRDYILDYSLDNLSKILETDTFFKTSRKHIVNINHIKDIISYSNSRLKIKLEYETEDDIIVAREKVKLFKLWLNK